MARSGTEATGFPLPLDLPPIEARLVDELPEEPGWQFEPKWDGFRCLAFRAGEEIELRAKSGKPLGRYFPEMLAVLRRLEPTSFVLDGELVIPVGETFSFDALQMRLHPAESRIKKLAAETPAVLIVEDDLDLARVMTAALQSHGIEQTALHKHLLEQSPPVWWTHVHAMGDPAQLARGLKAALDATAIPAAAAPPAQQPPIDLDTAGIDAALGRKGTADSGVYKFTLARRDTIVDDGHVVPPGFGVTTTINFQPVGGGQAAVNGDFVMTAPEVQNVIGALRKGGIAIVELHNHSLTDNPRLFYLHYWAVSDGVTLAKTLRTALDATNLQTAG